MLGPREIARNGNRAAARRDPHGLVIGSPGPACQTWRVKGMHAMTEPGKVGRLAAALCCALAVGQPAAAGPTPGSFTSYFRQLEESLVAQGGLRTDRGSRASDAESLARDFVDVALMKEYAGGSLSAGVGQRAAKPLMRWEEPVRMQIIFGASVPEAQRAADRKAIRTYMNKLSDATGHPVSPAYRDGNFHVLVVSEDERRSLGGQLRKLIPGISPWMVRTISKMRQNHLCMVIAEPHPDRRKGYARAVAILRAEASGRLRQACIEEELAQGMGLPNDCDDADPSIFNDNQRYALLTRRDELLLRMLYDPSLTSGMTRDEAMPKITRLARTLATR